MKLRDKKTGDVIECEEVIITKRVEDAFTNPYTKAYRAFSSIAELNEEWEDYEPKEPLIKDEKIRKAVRAWAEANGFTKLKFNKWSDNHWILRAENKDGHEFDVDFFDIDCKKLPKYVYDAFYTITELCGEEEE